MEQNCLQAEQKFIQVEQKLRERNIIERCQETSHSYNANKLNNTVCSTRIKFGSFCIKFCFVKWNDLFGVKMNCSTRIKLFQKNLV